MPQALTQQQEPTTPHSLEAEASTLGAILITNSRYQGVAQLLERRHFFRDANGKIYDCIGEVLARGDAADLVTVVECLKSRGWLEDVGGPAYVGGLTDGVPLADNALHYAKIVRRKAVLRDLIAAGKGIIADAYDSELEPDDLANAWVEKLGGVTESSTARTHEWRLRDEVSKQRAQSEARRIVATENSATAIVKPNPIPLDELLSREFPPLEYAIDQLQPKGAKVLFAAQAKAGKTTAVINLIRSLADGEPFLGTFRPAPLQGRICLIDMEMTDRHLHHWFTQANIRNRSRVVVQQLRGKVASFNILDRVVRAEWAAKLRELEASNLILDNLRPLMDALGLDENSDAGRLLVAFDALIAEAGISESMIVHHMGHNGNRSRGDSRLRDWPDAEWKLTLERDAKGEPKESGQRYFSARGRDVDFAESQLSYHHEGRRLSIIGGTRAEAVNDAAIVELYDRLGEQQLSGRQIEDACTKAGSRLTRTDIRDAIKDGIRSGVFLTTDGPNRAILHRRGPSAPVRRSAPEVRQNTSAECAAPFRGARTGALENTEISAPNGEGGDHAPYSI
jgi:hypothetical protein